MWSTKHKTDRAVVRSLKTGTGEDIAQWPEQSPTSNEVKSEGLHEEQPQQQQLRQQLQPQQQTAQPTATAEPRAGTAPPTDTPPAEPASADAPAEPDPPPPEPVKLVPVAERANSRAAAKRARLQKDLDEAKQVLDEPAPIYRWKSPRTWTSK